MNEHMWWYLSRAAGMVAWITMAATCLWGVLLITRMLKPADRPAWLLDLHRWLGALTVITTACHMLFLVFDNYPGAQFGWKELFVPRGAAWKTTAIMWGVFAFYMLVIVQGTSLMMKKLPRRLWHYIHLTSYMLFLIATVHGVQAGTDRKNLFFIIIAAGGASVVLFASSARGLQARHKHLTRAEKDAILAEVTR